MSLSDVTILTTTFLRDGCLLECLKRIRKNLPEVHNVVVDDGYPSDDKQHAVCALRGWNDDYVLLPFDSGLPAKRNAGAKEVRTKYLLMGCDDFDFSISEARTGIEKLVTVLDNNPNIDVASGRRGYEPYEGFLEIIPGQYIKETRLSCPNKSGKYEGWTKEFYKVDLTVNYFLARTEVVRMFPWDERMKIGGEHGDWFLDLKEASRHVVWVPGVNINEFQVPQGIHQDYNRYRSRAVSLGHRIFLEKRGVKDYKGFGQV